MKMPAKIYKYQPFSIYSIQNLKNNQIYFSDPNDFNDPYDCVHPLHIDELDEETIRRVYLESTKSQEMNSLVKRLFDDKITKLELLEFYRLFTETTPNVSEKLNAALGLTHEQYLDNLSMQFNTEHLFKIYKTIAIESLKEKANMSVKQTLHDIREKLSKTGVTCFSEVNNDILMWSYYAGGHSGFCLEFDTQIEPFNNLLKVNYVKETPSFNTNLLLQKSSDSSDVIEMLLATKYVHWEHEREWRVLHKNSNQLYTYKRKSLTGIYLGTKINRANLEIIALILKGQNPNVKLYRMKKVPSVFEVRDEEFTYTSHDDALNIILTKVESDYPKGKFTLADFIENSNLNLDLNTLKNYLEILTEDEKLHTDGINYWL